MRPPRSYKLPFEVLRRGGVTVVLYLIVCGLIAFGSTVQLGVLVNWYFQLLIREYPQSASFVSPLFYLHGYAILVLISPFLLTAISLPVSAIHSVGRLSIWPLVSVTPRAAILCYAATGLTLRVLLPELVPALAMGILYVLFVQHISSLSEYYIYTTACLAVAGALLYRTLPIVSAPILAVTTGRMSAAQAVFNAHRIVGPKRFELAGIVLLSALTLNGLNLLQQELSPHIVTVAAFHAMRILVVWYAVTWVAIVVVLAHSAFIAAEFPPAHVPSEAPNHEHRSPEQPQPQSVDERAIEEQLAQAQSEPTPGIRVTRAYVKG